MNPNLQNKWLKVELETLKMNWIKLAKLFHSTLINWSGQKLILKH
jgi:hypothetical protein